MKIKNIFMEIKIYFLPKSSARKFCAFFIAKHHEMIGNRSSYDKMKKYINENKKIQKSSARKFCAFSY